MKPHVKNSVKRNTHIDEITQKANINACFILKSVLVQTYQVYTKYETKNIRTVLKIWSSLTTCLMEEVESMQPCKNNRSLSQQPRMIF